MNMQAIDGTFKNSYWEIILLTGEQNALGNTMDAHFWAPAATDLITNKPSPTNVDVHPSKCNMREIPQFYMLQAHNFCTNPFPHLEKKTPPIMKINENHYSV
jgi:hypothetical protein